MTTSEYQSKRRREARANGLCGVCCVRPSPEAYRCEHCKTKQKGQTMYNAPREDEFCVDCQAHGRHRADCKARKARAA